MALNKMHPCHSSLKLFVVTYTFYTLHFLSAQVPSQGYLFALMDQGSRIVGKDNTKQTRVIKGSFICNIEFMQPYCGEQEEQQLLQVAKCTTLPSSSPGKAGVNKNYLPGIS